MVDLLQGRKENWKTNVGGKEGFLKSRKRRSDRLIFKIPRIEADHPFLHSVLIHPSQALAGTDRNTGAWLCALSFALSDFGKPAFRDPFSRLAMIIIIDALLRTK